MGPYSTQYSRESFSASNSQVIRLMDQDLIRNNSAWKQGLKEIRDTISIVENLKFPHMESWKLHWDYQLYKALERQYQLILCNLHSHLPEFKVELIYRYSCDQVFHIYLTLIWNHMSWNIFIGSRNFSFSHQSKKFEWNITLKWRSSCRYLCHSEESLMEQILYLPSSFLGKSDLLKLYNSWHPPVL